ncbi:MAG: hypothetical protein K9H64_15855 [Bacteroidales bacterium]|nr:hypothetical protein [Bacteroidales bacterium]MCF8457443.1 hypothetical protein [Bacteroidales bacterium]
MRILVALVISLIVALPFYAQDSQKPVSKISYGFNLGVNVPHGDVEFAKLTSAATKFSNKYGFNLGLLMNYPINRTFSFFPKAVLSFYNLDVEVKDGDPMWNNYTIVDEYSIYPVVMEIKPHIKIKYPGKLHLPYIFIGPNWFIPLSDDEDYIPTKSTFAFDFGIGFEKQFAFFNLAPELCYSYGLQNVAETRDPNTISDIRIHTVSLLFNFY